MYKTVKMWLKRFKKISYQYRNKWINTEEENIKVNEKEKGDAS